MGLTQLCFCIRNFLSDDWTNFDRQDIKIYALHNLKQRGIDTGPLCALSLPELLAEIEALVGERVAKVAA